MLLVGDLDEVGSVSLRLCASNPCDACVAAHDWLRLFSLDQRVCFPSIFSQIPTYIIFSKVMWNVGVLLVVCV
jgi:hypothetical protein